MIFVARKNLKLYVSSRQVEMLIGCLLGDAYLTQLGKIQIEQSIKQQDYISWKYKQLSSISYGPPKEVVRFEKSDKRVTRSLRFWTRQYFRRWRENFYKDGCKVYPEGLAKLITPLSIAIWYMDDGCLSGNQCTISTESFNLDSRKKLIEKLKTFGIDTVLRSNGKLRIKSKSLEVFFELIRPYMHTSMLYKLS